MTPVTADAEAPAEALELHEGAQSAPSPIDDQGRVLVHVIRPCIGRGKGRHLYRADMLREAASQFEGWPQFIDHSSQEERRARGGLPRSMKDVGGIVEESWWDPNVPADPIRGFGKGAVVGYARPFGLAKKLIEHDPRLVEASISANATGVRPTTVEEASRHLGLRLQEGTSAQRVWDVAGIAQDGSVDWVTKAGAGGKIVALMEAMTDDDEQDFLNELDDAGFRALLDRERPALAEALNDTADEGGDMGDTLTPEALQEALQSEAVQEFLDQRIDERSRQIAESLVEERVQEAVEQERDLIRAEAEAGANRKVDLRDMRDRAHRAIDEAKLLERQKSTLKARFDLQESGEPTADLDQVDDVDGDGKVTKSAKAKLTEKVEEAIEDQRALLAEARPTRVKGLGPAKSADKSKKKDDEDDEDGKKKVEESAHRGTLYGSLLQEANIDPDTAWSGVPSRA
jgi:hypothetical protein